jgi:histone-lysine N-methyltransferase SETD2
MSDDEADRQSAEIEPELRGMKIEEGDDQEGAGAQMSSRSRESSATPQRSTSPASRVAKTRSSTHSPTRQEPSPQSPSDDSECEELIGGDITLKMEPGKPPKLARTATQKFVARAPQLFHHLPDATDEAKRSFGVITDCSYASKYLGSTEHALECDCSEEWGKSRRACEPVYAYPAKLTSL